MEAKARLEPLTTAELNYLPDLFYKIEKCSPIWEGMDEAEQTMAFELIQVLPEMIKQLEHHRVTTVGLYATDRPDLVSDPKQVLFQIEDIFLRAIEPAQQEKGGDQ